MYEMKPGDILVFEAGDSWLSKCIARMTNSPVSHAAMRYVGDTMVEMCGSGIKQSPCLESTGGQKVHLLRLNPEQDPAPLIAAARRYLDEGIPYNYPDLLLFAGLLIYRAARPTPQWQKITDFVLNMACAELDRLLNRLIHRSDIPVMVCSQLVYQCYLDCGDRYRISLKGGLLQDSMPGAIRLADLLDTAKDSPQSSFPAMISPLVDTELLAREMYFALTDSEKTAAAELRPAQDAMNRTLASAKRFLTLMEQLLEYSGLDLPLPALFVAPSDLLYHAVNLKEYRITGIAHSCGNT